MRDNPRSACAVIRNVKIVTGNVVQKKTLRNSFEYDKACRATEFHHLSVETLRLFSLVDLKKILSSFRSL